jgi:DNA-binding transcriptional regulator YhcF (GntR family)
VADRVPTGQMKAQRRLLREEIARTVELAKTLGMDAEETHQLFDEIWEQGKP